MKLSPKNTSPEFELLCSVARPKPDHFEAETILGGADLGGAKVDWPLLLDLAAAHGVRPQLVRAFRDLHWEGVPSAAKQTLLEFARHNEIRNLHLASQLIAVADRLSEAGLRFATFKGPSLAAAVYGDLSLRENNDIDIVVDADRVHEAEEALSHLGYKVVGGSPAFRHAFLAYQRQIMLVREEPSLAIDLHWGFATAGVPFPIGPEEIWNNLDTVEIGGRAVPMLGRDDLALFLAGHGTKEGWRCLGWVCDFAMMIEKYPDLDWLHLLDRARANGCGRSLLLGWQLAAQLLGTRVKGDLLDHPEGATQSLAAAETAIQRTRNLGLTPSSERTFGDLDLCENGTQKLKVLTNLLITRTVSDYTSLPLPRGLWGLYYVTRPFRLVAKVLKRFLVSGIRTATAIKPGGAE